MKPIPIMYYVQSESGHRHGYIMSLEIAKLVDNRKPPPDEREGSAERFATLTPPYTSPIIRTRL